MKPTQAMHTTNYTDTFITVAPDSTAERGVEPKSGVALAQYQLIAPHPYRHTSDDVLFTVWADRRGLAQADRPAARAEFFSKGQACLRASDLGKKYGWGIHHDEQGRVALYGVESGEYRRLAGGPRVKAAMRSKRAY